VAAGLGLLYMDDVVYERKEDTFALKPEQGLV